MHKDNLLQLFEWVKHGSEDTISIQQYCERLCSNHGWKTPFEIRYENLENTDLANYDIILNPGNPVSIILNDRYILEWILRIKTDIYFKHRLMEALERMPRMHRVLRHPIPLTVAIALKKEAKSWFKIPAPAFEDKLLHSKYIKTSYQVTVLDSITGTSVTMNGLDPIELKQEAIRRLSATIFERDDLLEMLEDIESLKAHKPEFNTSQIAIGGQDGETRDMRSY